MSDTSGAYPPPPPPSVPPPQFQAAAPSMPAYQVPPGTQLPPGYHLPPGYQGPSAPDYVPPYQYQQPAAGGSLALGAILASPGALMYQFGGYAAYSCIAGLAAIIVPFVAGFYFPILPIAGLLNGARAIQRGRVIGGVVGLILSALGGVVSLFFSGLLGG